MKRENLGFFEGIPIEGLDSPIQDEKAMSYTTNGKKELTRILRQSCKKIKKDYGSNIGQYLVKDYKTKTKLMLFIRQNQEGELFGYIYAYYNIDYSPYYSEPSDYYKYTDSVKTIEKKLKKASENHVYFHYEYDDSFFKDMFEYGVLYHTYEIINLNKEKYK